MTPWTHDAELFALMREKLFPAVIGDILDTMGLLHQFLPAHIRPLRPEMVIVSRQPFGLLFQALDDLREHEVYLATGCTPTFALWGGLMTTRARHLKAAGAVLDGYHRDTPEVLASGLPVFSMGGYAQDQGARGKVVDWRVPLELGGVRVQPGDIVFGDMDGVLIVPKAAEEEAIRRALEKVSAENTVRQAIERGMSTQEAFRTYGVM
jgi:regulator of RNase E activity RraA